MKIITDDVEAQNLANRYLKGQLSADETVAFEEYIMDKPELLEQLELDSVFINTLPQLEKEPSHDSFFKRVFSQWQVVIPTACSFLFLAMLFVNNEPDLHESISQIHYVENLRSASQSRVETITIKAETDIIVLVVTPAILSETHMVSLIDAKGVEYTKAHRLSEYGQLSILINNTVFELGEATLSVSPEIYDSNNASDSMEIDLVFVQGKTQS